MRLFRRKLYDELLQWKQKWNGRYAVLIEGARRVGKSTLVKQFAQNEYDSFILIDFSAAPQHVIDLFDNVADLNNFFLSLQVYYDTKLVVSKSVIIFDEVQLCPKARQAIKHLVADGRYDYIETGSLISIHKNVVNIVIPSEEKKLTLHPMDFEEFMWAINKSVSIDILKEMIANKMRIDEGSTRQMMHHLRMYMMIGGMPQAVDALVESNDLEYVDSVKRSIIELYEEDFHKIDPAGRLSMLFDAIPAELNRNSSRYQVTSVIGNTTADNTIAELIAELSESKTINLAYHANDPGVGMSLFRDISRYKMFTADTGLFVTLSFKDKQFTDNIIYKKLLSDKLEANLGYIYENLVAQMLVAKGHKLFYYTFPTESGKHNYEVDFITQSGNKINPIEVKSSGYARHASLDAFCEKYSSRVANRYVVYTKPPMKRLQTTYIPMFLIPFL